MVTPIEHLDESHATDARHLSRQTTSGLALTICKYDFNRLGHVKSQIVTFCPPINTVQFGTPIELTLAAVMTIYVSWCLPDREYIGGVAAYIFSVPDSPKLGFRVRVSVSANRVSANRD